MKYIYSPVHAIIECEDCEWGTNSYKNAQAIAAKHAKKYGHNVKGEIGITIAYFGREDSK